MEKEDPEAPEGDTEEQPLSAEQLLAQAEAQQKEAEDGERDYDQELLDGL